MAGFGKIARPLLMFAASAGATALLLSLAVQSGITMPSGFSFSAQP